MYRNELMRCFVEVDADTLDDKPAVSLTASCDQSDVFWVD